MERLTQGQLRSFRGGVAEKLGNTFEGDWTLHQALLVLQSEADAIQIEPLGGATGFEFILTTRQGPEYHQCKRRGPKARNWTISGITQTGFWASALARHATDPAAQFVFVSIDSGGDAAKLAEQALRFEASAEFLLSLSQDDRTALSDLVAQTTLSDDTAAHTFLRQTRFETVSEPSLRATTIREARRIFRGDGAAACDVLRRCLSDHLAVTLTTDRLRDIAQERGLVARPAALDPTTLEKITRQNRRYEASHGPLGVDGRDVPRDLSKALVRALREGDKDFIVVTGVAGSGKSGVIRQAAGELLTSGVPCLKLRLDSLLQYKTTDELGAALFGPDESPCITLSLAAPTDGFAILILDQLDAVSEASGRTIEARELALDLIEEARHYPNLKVVVACRSYDLETDRRLRNLGQGPRSERLNAELLDLDAEVKPFLAALNIEHDAITTKQWQLIRLPINLVHFAQLCRETGRIVAAGSTAELYRELLEKRGQDLRAHHLTWSVHTALGALAERMSETRTLTAPLATLDDYERAAELLVSGHLLNPDGDVVRFAHESLFDYCFARAFVRRGRSLFEWLTADEQILFRRTQVRQVLELLRSAERERYVVELQALLQGAPIRAHIKDAISSWLGTLPDPTDAELDICLALDTGTGPPSFIVRRAFGGPAWVALLHQRGLVAAWLSSADSDRKLFAMRLLDTALDGHAALAAEVLRKWWDRSPDRIDELLHWLRYPRATKNVDAVVDLYLEVIDQTPDALFAGRDLPDAADLGMWAHHGSNAVARLLEAWINRWYRAHSEGHPFVDRYSAEAHWLKDTAKKHPLDFLATMLRAFSTAFKRELAEGKAEHWYNSAFRLQLPDADENETRDERYVFDIVRTTLRGAAADNPAAVAPLLALLQPFEHFAAVHLALEAIDAGGAALVGVARDLLDHPLLFKAGYDEGPSDTGARALAAVWDALSPVEREHVETRVLQHLPEMADASEVAQRADDPNRRKHALMYLGNVGAAQRNILARIGAERLSPFARTRLLALSRKFPKATWPEARNYGGWVASPISLEKAKLMSDRHWLGAFKKHNVSRDELRYTRGGAVGGVEQLARILQECAKVDPQRFVNLAEQLPPQTHSDYARAIVRGVAESDALPDVAKRAARLAVNSTDREMGKALSYLAVKHPAIGQDDAIFGAIEHMARTLASPEDREVSARDKDADAQSIQDLVHSAGRAEGLALNSERGDAIHALAAMLWETPDRYAEVLAFTEKAVVNEPSKAMRIALNRCAHAIAGRDPDCGIALLTTLTSSDATPLVTHLGIRLTSWAFWNRRNAGLILLDRVLAVPEFRAAGLFMLSHYAVDDDEAALRFEPMWREDTLARRMAANAAVEATGDRQRAPTDRARDWLRRLFHDTQNVVLKEAANYGRNLSGEGLAVREQLALAFIASPAFRVDPDDILHGLDSVGAEFPDVVVAACNAFFEAEKDPEFNKRQRGGAARHWLAKMIFAAYPALEKKPAYRSAILDVIDQFIANDLADARRELGEFERH